MDIQWLRLFKNCNKIFRILLSAVSPKRPRLDVDFDEPSEFVYVKQELFLNCSAYTLGDGVLSWMLKEWGKEPLVWMRVEDGRTKGHVPPGIVMLHKPCQWLKFRGNQIVQYGSVGLCVSLSVCLSLSLTFTLTDST